MFEEKKFKEKWSISTNWIKYDDWFLIYLRDFKARDNVGYTHLSHSWVISAGENQGRGTNNESKSRGAYKGLGAGGGIERFDRKEDLIMTVENL